MCSLHAQSDRKDWGVLETNEFVPLLNKTRRQNEKPAIIVPFVGCNSFRKTLSDAVQRSKRALCLNNTDALTLMTTSGVECSTMG